jgi:hypothetical protein
MAHDGIGRSIPVVFSEARTQEQRDDRRRDAGRKTAPASSMNPVSTIQLHCKIFQARGVTIPVNITADATLTTVRDRSNAAPAITAGPMRNVAATNRALNPRGLPISRHEP